MPKPKVRNLSFLNSVENLAPSNGVHPSGSLPDPTPPTDVGRPRRRAGGHLAKPRMAGGALPIVSASLQLAEKIKELVRLAQEQGYLTYNDINEALPDSLIAGEDIDEIYVQLRNLEVEIVDAAEVDRIKPPEQEDDEEKT